MSGSEPAPEATGTAFISLDPSGLISRWDEGAERLLGYTAAEAVGLRLEALFPDASRPPLQRAIARAVVGRPADLTGRLVTKDGGCVNVAMMLRPIRHAARVVAVAVAVVALVDRAQTDAYPWTLLTPREREVAALAGRGCSNDEIADLLGATGRAGPPGPDGQRHREAAGSVRAAAAAQRPHRA
jgi:PAS domain S-box-containing protein